MARDWTPTELAMMMRQGVRTPDQMYLGPGTASLGFADRNVNVNVRQPQAVSPPAGAATPMTDEEKGLVNQGAWAGASAAGAEAAGDWRNSAAQTLAKALAGYNAGAYRSQQDLENRRIQREQLDSMKASRALEQQKTSAAIARQQSIQAEIAKLPDGPEKQIAMVDPEGWAKGKAEALFAKPQVVGDSAGGFYTVDPRDPSSAQLVVKGHGPMSTPAELARLDLERKRVGLEEKRLALGDGMPETWAPVAPDEASKLGYAPGTVVQKSSHGKYDVVSKLGQNGITVRDANGNPIVEIGGPAQGATAGLTNATTSDVQKDMIKDRETLGRLGQIAGSFKPEFQQVGTRLGNAWTAVKDKLGMVDADSPEAKQLAEFTKYRTTALHNLNGIIKEMAGAAVSDSEQKRYFGELANPGTTAFDGDSPVEFKSKVDAAVGSAKMAYARKAYLLARGLPLDTKQDTPGGISLDQMPDLIEAEGQQMEDELVAKGKSPQDAETMVKAQLRMKYGI